MHRKSVMTFDHTLARRIVWPFYSYREAALSILVLLVAAVSMYVLDKESAIGASIAAYIGIILVASRGSPARLLVSDTSMDDVETILQNWGCQKSGGAWHPSLPSAFVWEHNRFMVSQVGSDVEVTGPWRSLNIIRSSLSSPTQSR